MTTAPRTQVTARTSDAIGQRYRSARAYRGRQLVCGRVEIRVGRDGDRVGLTERERRFVVARFLEHVDSALLADLTALVARRGAAAKRIAERLAPITLVVDDATHGPLQLVGHLQPPQVRLGELRNVEFGIRELNPRPVS